MSRVLTLAIGAVFGSAATLAITLAAAPQDAVKVSPHLYTVKIDNDRVRVLEFRMAPGQTEPMHDHPPFVVYFLGDALIRATAADGTTSESKIAAGDVGWRERTTHAVTNIGTTDIRALIVEPKTR